MKILNFDFLRKNNKGFKKISQNEISDPYYEISKLLKDARIQNNLSIKELSEISKIPNPIINAIENNIKEIRPKYPFIRSILLKLETCLSLKKNTLLGLAVRETKTLKKNKKEFIIRKFNFLDSWQGSFFYFLFLVSILFFLNRYFISNISVIEIQIIEEKENKN